MKLRFQISLSPGSSLPFQYSGPCLRIGRDPGGELTLEGHSCHAVSWNHACIKATQAGAELSDLESRNGTFVNDRRVQNPVLLQVGDSIQLGRTGPSLQVIELQLSESEPVPEAASQAATKNAGRSTASPRRPLLRPELVPPRAARADPLAGRGLSIALGVSGSVLLFVAGVLWQRHNTAGALQVAPAVLEEADFVTPNSPQLQEGGGNAKEKEQAKPLHAQPGP